MTRLNDVELNEHCLKLRQHAQNMEMLLREGKIGMLWIALDEVRSHAEQGMTRLLEFNKEPVYMDFNAYKRSTQAL